MNNLERLKNAFAQALHLSADKISDDLQYNSIPEWDSIAHMALIAEIETTFDIMMDTNDVIDMSSFRKAREILTKYSIEI